MARVPDFKNKEQYLAWKASEGTRVSAGSRLAPSETSIPLRRRSWVNSLCALVGLFVGPPLLFLSVVARAVHPIWAVPGLLLASALWFVCLNLATGDIYYTGKRSVARVWSRGNRYVAWMLTIGQGLIVLLLVVGAFFGTRSLGRTVPVASHTEDERALDIAQEVVAGLVQSGDLYARLSAAFPEVPPDSFAQVTLGWAVSKPILVAGPTTAAIAIEVPESIPNAEAVISLVEQIVREAVQRRVESRQGERSVRKAPPNEALQLTSHSALQSISGRALH